MPEVIKILIVEDTESDIQSYEDSIRTINMRSNSLVQVEGVFRKTKDASIEALRNEDTLYSGAFIDLKLTHGDPTLNEGNDVVAEIYGNLRFPVRVFTNTPGEIRAGWTESSFFKVKEKTSISYIDEIEELISLHSTGILNILGRIGIVEKMLNEIFWNNISLSLGAWINVDNSEKHLLRYVLTHVQENLEITDDGNQLDEFQPIEAYIKPSIKKYFFTGDIIYEKNDPSTRYVILTPACDMAPRGEDGLPKASHILLVRFERFDTTPVRNLVRKIKSRSGGVNNDETSSIDEQRLLKIISNAGDLKYYYLPETNHVAGGLINFQKLLAVKFADLQGYEKDATIAYQFVKDIVAKFSFYYSRQGSPDFDYNSLYVKHLL